MHQIHMPKVIGCIMLESNKEHFSSNRTMSLLLRHCALPSQTASAVLQTAGERLCAASTCLCLGKCEAPKYREDRRDEVHWRLPPRSSTLSKGSCHWPPSQRASASKHFRHRSSTPNEHGEPLSVQRRKSESLQQTNPCQFRGKFLRLHGTSS